MTMPEKLHIAMSYAQDFDQSWYEDGLIVCTDKQLEHPNANAQPYIRADIAEELARALERCRDELLSVYHSEFDGVWDKSEFDDVAEYYDTVLCHFYNETSTLDTRASSV